VNARRWRIVDAVYVAALMLYVLAGVALVPFHGDEPMQIYFSGDYEVAVLQGNPSALTTRPPYDIDSDPQLRILNGSVLRYLVGLSRQIAGIGPEQLPPRPGWDWGLSYDRNVETGHRPSDALLMAGRWPSAILLALCAPLAFALGWIVGKRPGAYLVAGLILLNPIILLNGRRAMQEGALLFFGLAVIVTAAWIARKRATRQRVSPWLWALLALTGGLALASKHSTLPFIAGALGWVLVGELTHFRLRPFLKTAGAIVLSGVLMVGLFFALSPALWDNPAARFSDLLQVRATLLDIQVSGAPTTMEFRVGALLAMPYLAPPQYFEVPQYGTWEPIPTEIARYQASGLAGIPFDGVLGGIVMGLMLVGMGVALWPKVRPFTDWATAAGLFVWWGITALSLLVNPLNWQRYYLSLIPPTALFAAVGALGLWALARRAWAKRKAN
jgi:4-amino-4-deoxy-L-arabinose transferase-like glycosyltransferase